MTNVSSSSSAQSRRPRATPDPRVRVALFAASAVLVVALVATIVVVLNQTGTSGTAATVSSGCSAMTVPVRYQVNPDLRTGLFTTSPAAAASAASAGYTKDQGVVFLAADRAAVGLVEVHQLRKGAGDQLWTTDASEVREAVQAWGYADQGTVAYVSPVPAACTLQVERFQHGGVHRYATTSGRADALRGAGWSPEGSFYAARPPAGAAIPTAAGTSSATSAPRARTTPTAPTAPKPAPTPGTVIDADFDNAAVGPVTPESFKAAVGSINEAASAYDSMSFVAGDDGNGRFVRTHLAAHTIIGRNDAHGDGNVLVVPLEDQSEDSACISYDVRFSEGFDVSAGGKLPGLLGVAPGVSPATPTGGGSTKHGWSGRIMWLGPKLSKVVRDSGESDLVVTYLYHPGQTGTFGDDVSWGRGIVDGAWHQLKQCYTLNTIGQADGRLQGWLDGVPVLDRSDLVYRTDPNVHVTHLHWSVFRGGDTDDWAADSASDIDLDNLEVTVG